MSAEAAPGIAWLRRDERTAVPMEWTVTAALDLGDVPALDRRKVSGPRQARYFVEIQAFRPRNERAKALSITVWNEESKLGPGVSADEVRSIRIAELLRSSENMLALPIEWGHIDDLRVFRIPGITPRGSWEGGAPAAAPRRQRRRPSIFDLDEVVRVYSDAFQAGRPTGEAVAKYFKPNLSPAHARQLIRRARAKGLLPAAEGRRPAAVSRDVPAPNPSGPHKRTGSKTTTRSRKEASDGKGK